MRAAYNCLFNFWNYLILKNQIMTPEELKNLNVAKSVDARGTACPGPLLEAKKAIGTIKSGDIMEVLSADEGTKVDIPKWCTKQGHEYLGTIEESGYFRIFLKKM
jgi:tRNA 2-thiouridine synthesizing protein A